MISTNQGQGSTSVEMEMGTLRQSEAVSTVDVDGTGPSLKNEEMCLPTPEEEKEDVIPDGGYGWVNVGCIVAQFSVTWGEHRFSAITYNNHPGHLRRCTQEVRADGSDRPLRE